VDFLGRGLRSASIAPDEDGLAIVAVANPAADENSGSCKTRSN
jgi:hypothetical protein